MRRLFIMVVFFVSIPCGAENLPLIRIGSKNFTESYILAEILAQKIERTGRARVERRLGMGGTGILHSALETGEIDVYPEYTGTLSIAILNKKKSLSAERLREEMALKSISISPPIGINNSYGLAVKRETSRKLGLSKISELSRHPELRMAFSYEFMQRSDGYPAMVKHYKLAPQVPPVRMDHSLVYKSIEEGKSDVAEVYTTDSKIEKLGLEVLEDDRKFFPDYEGIYLVRTEALARWPELSEILKDLEGALSNEEMIRLNGLVEIRGLQFAEAAESFLESGEVRSGPSQYPSILWRQTKRHLILVLIPTLISMLIGIPLGILAARIPSLGQAVLATTGLVQTIPALALLCFLIPVFGIGLVPALVALILYGLLPIVRNTYSGLMAIERRHIEVARVLGLNGWQRLFRIEVPLASLHIFSGIKTAAIINVGMATLAAFIGAGGYGALIVTGLSLNNNTIILQGALPAAGMAIVLHFLLEFLDRKIIPRGLKY